MAVIVAHQDEIRSWSPFMDGYQGINTFLARGSTFSLPIIKYFGLALNMGLH